jgi:hypothetical protein
MAVEETNDGWRGIGQALDDYKVVVPAVITYYISIKVIQYRKWRTCCSKTRDAGR